MRWTRLRRSATCWTVVFLAALTACAEQTAPRLDGGPAFARGGTPGRNTTETPSVEEPAGGGGTVSCVQDDSSDVPPCTLRHRPDAPPLESYNPSFEILAGYQYNLNVFYQPDPETGLREYFLMVTIPRDAEFFDAEGQAIPRGEPVVITMDIDPVYFHVEFGPHGTLFHGKKPAVVRFSLEKAEIETASADGLTVFYRPVPTDPTWTDLPTTFSQTGWWVEGPVYHFSGYAVAW